MNYAEIILVFFLAWQISSMPLPSWFASAFFGIDAYAFKESNQFSENRFALQNNYWAALIFSLEFVKGLAAISLVAYLPEQFLLWGVNMKFYLVAVVLLGHAYPIYSEFSSSKSLGAYIGVLCGLAFLPGLIALVVFVISWALLKKVSLITYLLAVLSTVSLTFTNYDIQLLLTVAIGSFGLVYLTKPTHAPST